MRWQEIFKGADSTLLHSPLYVKDSALMAQQYWRNNTEERRQILLPFFWNVLSNKGQINGNRDLNNKVNVANLYKISYPGYNEILTGYADWFFIPNLAVLNHNKNILQYLNDNKAYTGKVAAFCSWNVFPFILDEKNNSLPVNAGYELLPEDNDNDSLINDVQNSVTDQNNTRHDLRCCTRYVCRRF